MRLERMKIWITGSAKRVGKAIALGCAKEGADIVVHCHSSREEAEETAEEIRALGRKVMIVQGDHGDTDSVRKMAAEIEKDFGGLDALVNSAARFPNKKFEEISEEDFFRIIRTNTWGPFACAQAALPMLRRANPGRIVNITDWAVQRPYRHYAHYMASKGGLSVMTKAMARELAPEILVNSVAPGPVLEPPDISDEERAKVLKKIPVNRWGTPESIVQAVLMILENDNLCGAEIVVDGGRSLG